MDLSVAAFVALVVAVALQRLYELVRSRRHIRALRAQGHAPHTEPAYVAMVIVHAGALIAAKVEVIVAHRPFVPPLAAACLLLVMIAQVARVWIFEALGPAWNVRVVAPIHIVASGPYRFVRHPNYLVVVIELLALPLVHTAWITSIAATVANALVLARRIPLEESVLARDPAWTAAFSATPRLIPWPWRR